MTDTGDTAQEVLRADILAVGQDDFVSMADVQVKPWPGTVGEVMTQFIERFIGHHDDRLQWQYSIWLNLTAKGRRATNLD